MVIYADGCDGNLDLVGTVAACSMHNLLGPSYVHVFDECRDRYGLPHEPYDWHFDTYREALDWANEAFGGILVGY